MTESVIGMDKIWTDEYKDTIHVILQRLNPGFVVALRFFSVKRPERVGTAIKIAYHARLSAGIIGHRATLARVVNDCLLRLWWPSRLHAWIMVYHVLCLSFYARLNIAMFHSCL